MNGALEQAFVEATAVDLCEVDGEVSDFEMLKGIVELSVEVIDKPELLEF